MKKVSQPQRRRRDRVRKQLNLETLESRHLLATFLWDGGGVDDLWSNPQNWNTNSGFPNSAADEAVFDDSLVSISQYALLDIGLGGQRVEPGAIELSGTGNGGNSFNYTGLTSDTADSFGVTIGRQNTSGANIGGLDWRDRGNGSSNALVNLGEDFVKNNQGIVRVDLDSIPAGRYQITSYHVDPDFNQSEAIQIHVDTGSGFVTQGVQGNSNFNNGAVAGLTTQEVIDSQAQFTIDATGGPISIVFDGSQATDLETPLSGLRIEAIGSVSGAMIDVDGNYETGTLRFDTDILSYDVAGAGTLTAGTVTNDGATGNLVSANLSASASGTITFNSASSQLAVVGNINGGSAQIAATGAGDIELNGDISNSTGLTKSDAGTTTLSGDNSYSGDTVVNGGTLLVASDTGLGGTADGTTVNTGAELGLLGNISVAEAVSINGSGAGAGSLINVADDNTLTGNVELVPASSGSLFTLLSANGRVAPEPLQVVAGGLVEDVDAYVDRTHEWNGATGTGIPSYLQGADIVQQANDDKAAGGYSIDLDFAQTVDLYVWIDNRFTSPATQFPWLGNLGFADTGDDLGIDEAGNGVGAGAGINQTLSIYRLTAHDGPITLGASLNANNMYGIAAVANGPAAANATIGAVAGSLTVEGNITHNQPASNVTFNSESNIVVNGAISAVDSIASTGSGNTTLAGVNTFAGPVDVQVGQLTAANSGALGTDAVGTTVWEGATLGLSGGVDIGAEALTLGGDLVNLSGDNTTSGAIRLTEEGNVPFAFFDISQNAGRVEPGYIPLFGNNNAQNNNSYSGLVSATGSTFDASLTNVDQAGATVGNLDYRDRGNGSNEPLIALGEDFVKNNGGIIRLTLTGLPAGDYVATSFHVDVDNTQSGQIEVHVDTGTGFANSGAVGDSNFSAGGAAGLTTAEMESNATQFDFTADGASDVVIVFDGRPHADDETPLAGLQLEFVETSSVNSITSDAGTLTVAGDISATAQQSTLTAGGSGNVAVTGAIASLSQLNKVGSGVTTLAGANGFDGEIEVTGGRLVAGSDTALGSNVGGVSVTAAELELTGGIDVGAENIALGDASSLLSSGGDNTIAGDIFTIGGTNTFDYVTLDIGENNQRVEPGAVALSGSGNGNANIDFNGLTADTGDTFGASLSNVNAAGVNSGGLDWRDRGDGNGDALVALGEDFIKNNLGIVRLTLSDLPAATYSAIAYHVDPTNNQSEAILVSVDTDGTGFGATLSTGNSNFNNGGVGGLTAS
ncbi:MAG: fibronectin-binding autotransporter adhesin, partial [Pirellulaceae bacterium]